MHQLSFDFENEALRAAPSVALSSGQRPVDGRAATPLRAANGLQVAANQNGGDERAAQNRAADKAGLGIDRAALEPPRPKNLAEVLARLEIDEAAKREHAQMRSALRMVAKAAGRPLGDIPSDPAQLREVYARVTPATIGMKERRWNRVRSLTLAALSHAGIEVMPERDVEGCGPAWRVLADKLPDRALRHGLSRLLSFCRREGVEPEAFDAVVFERFHAVLKTKSLYQSPETLYRATARYWNRAVVGVADWPQVMIPLTANPRLYALAPDRFPDSLRMDVEAFLAHSGNSDPLADDYALPVKPSTVALRRRQIWQLASALAASGMPIDQITSLAVLVDPANAKAALRYLLDRNGGQTTKYIGQQAWLLCTLAKYWVKAPAHHTALRRMTSGLVVKQRGMVPRNRERLRQFDLWENLAALLNLPAEVLREAKEADAGTLAEARRVMLAVAAECLTVAPTRVNDLASLEIGRHLVEIRRGRSSTWHIVIPEHQTKTGVPFEMRLPEDSVRVLDPYLKTYRARISATPSNYLFPSPTGGRRSTVAFSQAISKFVLRETGIVMHVHLFRHLAALLHLTAHPEDIETVRRILGHASTAMVMKAYAEIRTAQAHLRYDAVVAELRRKAAHLSPLRIPRRGPGQES